LDLIPSFKYPSRPTLPVSPIRTIADLTRHDVRRIKRGRYKILAIETRHMEQGEVTEIIWGRNDKPDAIHEHELPF
jgi:hypothetical protein